MIDDKCYAYGFSLKINKKEICGEWLYDITTSNEKCIFERDLENETYKENVKFNDTNNRKRFSFYYEDVSSNKELLFLSELNRFSDDSYYEKNELMELRNIYKWFLTNLKINNTLKTISDFQYMLSDDNEFNDKIVKLLDIFDTSIVDFNLVKISEEEALKEISIESLERVKDTIIKLDNKVNKALIRGKHQFYEIYLDKDENIEIKVLKFKHENQDSDFYISEESDGTRKLIYLIEILLNSESKTFVIDEIDMGLHPNLTYKFVELFLEFAKDKEVQLIVTTHEDRLLDLNLLRRDEIWFVQKNEKGESDLYSLENYGPRFDSKIVKAYLEGRYKAIPNFKDIESNNL